MIRKQHKRIEQVEFCYCFSQGQVFKYLFSAHVVKSMLLQGWLSWLPAFILTAYVWPVGLKIPLSNVLGLYQKNRSGSMCFKACPFTWDSVYSTQIGCLALIISHCSCKDKTAFLINQSCIFMALLKPRYKLRTFSTGFNWHCSYKIARMWFRNLKMFRIAM